jgi:hypothetical protein
VNVVAEPWELLVGSLPNIYEPPAPARDRDLPLLLELERARKVESFPFGLDGERRWRQRT